MIQWAGITNENAINFILPNANNFGCNLYSEVDLFTSGTASIPGCGGSAIIIEQNFIVSEPRILIPEEQKAYCDRVVASIAEGNIRCFILQQTLTEIPIENRLLNQAANYALKVVGELNLDPTISNVESSLVENLGSFEFQQELSEVIQMDASVEQPEIVTSRPSQSPSVQPLDIFTIVTPEIFEQLFPNLSPVYTYAGFRSAVEDWNQNNPPDKQIFASNDEPSVRHQLAAFLGHVLHESSGLQLTRESSQCATFVVDGNDVVYCIPDWQSGGDYVDPYCSTGCGTCTPVTYQSGIGYEANELYFGRGPLQLSHSYNYYGAGGDDYCNRPDLVATDEVHGWASAFWFWTSSTDSTNTTCKDYVARRSFGGTLKTINGGFECPSSSYGEGYLEAVVSRLNDYCEAATRFEVDALLEMDDCELLSNTLDNCISANTCASCVVWSGVTFEPTPCEYE